MYLSRIELQKHDYADYSCLLDCQLMHRKVQSMFNATRVESQVLYRVDETRGIVYITSRQKPEGAVLHRRVDEQVVAGGMYYFNILVSPTVHVSVPNKKNTVMKFLRTPDERKRWFEKKGSKKGFTIISIAEQAHRAIEGVHPDGKLYFPAVQFTGMLQVTDIKRFKQARIIGIGKGRAYGLGLLLLSKVKGER